MERRCFKVHQKVSGEVSDEGEPAEHGQQKRAVYLARKVGVRPPLIIARFQRQIAQVNEAAEVIQVFPQPGKGVVVLHRRDCSKLCDRKVFRALLMVGEPELL